MWNPRIPNPTRTRAITSTSTRAITRTRTRATTASNIWNRLHFSTRQVAHTELPSW